MGAERGSAGSSARREREAQGHKARGQCTRSRYQTRACLLHLHEGRWSPPRAGSSKGFETGDGQGREGGRCAKSWLREGLGIPGADGTVDKVCLPREAAVFSLS